jgi:glycosyltransferase involved in cell wall biosynthesis
MIHSWHWSSDITEPLAARLAGIPWVYTKKAMSWGSPKLWRLRSKLANKIIVLNTDMIPRFFEGIKSKVELIYLGVDTEKYVPQEKVYHTPLGHTFVKEDFVVVTVANLVPIKGVEYLIDAINLINDSRIKLLIVGNNTNEYGQSLIANNKNKNIVFIDKQLDVRPFHAVADVFVIPTKTSWEGFPVAPVEAMSSERIVIGSRVEGIKEVLANYNSFMFESKNVSEIAEKLKWIQAMTIDERKTCAKKMRQTAIESFSIEVCLNNHMAFYKRVLKP